MLRPPSSLIFTSFNFANFIDIFRFQRHEEPVSQIKCSEERVRAGRKSKISGSTAESAQRRASIHLIPLSPQKWLCREPSPPPLEWLFADCNERKHEKHRTNPSSIENPSVQNTRTVIYIDDKFMGIRQITASIAQLRAWRSSWRKRCKMHSKKRMWNGFMHEKWLFTITYAVLQEKYHLSSEIEQHLIWDEHLALFKAGSEVRLGADHRRIGRCFLLFICWAPTMLW